MEITKQPHEYALDRLKGIASEHFQEYLIVVVKDDCVWNTYRSKVSAHGMAAMVLQDIHQDWAKSKDSKVE